MSGWLYCLCNPGFKSYGENVFKIGRTNNLKRRLTEYRTGFLHDSYYICVSEREFRDSRRAESLLFYLLRRHRLKDNREFFCCEPWKIRDLFARLSWQDDDTIDKCFRAAVSRVCPLQIFSELETDDDTYKEFWEKCGLRNAIDERFEQFRFNPKNPQIYEKFGYVSHEVFELTQLAAESEKTLGIETLTLGK